MFESVGNAELKKSKILLSKVSQFFFVNKYPFYSNEFKASKALHILKKV